MKYLNRHHSENCGTGEGDCKKTVAQKIKFYLIWLVPCFLWTSNIFIRILPIPQLNNFIASNKDNMEYLIAPALVWCVVGSLYGHKKGYLDYSRA
ncbi:MAG: hypothetical protein HN969_02775 [Verrucomicrobia bacterium]|jgi:hypothetical protein|nr:hypothetical protein [Verrucomicrobiota bacterium]MBT7026468.1 hypothetical protein [Verrucomicrobiota bacterium]